MSKLDYGIRQPWMINKYFNQPAVLGAVLTKIVELGLQFYVGQCGEPFVKWRGQWVGYLEVSQVDKRLVVEGLYL
jgi:hypothetical protein